MYVCVNGAYRCIEWFQKCRRRNDTGAFVHHNRDAGLHEWFTEINDRLSFGVDHQR